MKKSIHKFENSVIVNLVFAVAVGFFAFTLSRTLPRELLVLRYGIGVVSLLFALCFSYRVKLRERLFQRSTPLQFIAAFLLGGPAYGSNHEGCASYANNLCRAIERRLPALHVGRFFYTCLEGSMEILFAIAVFLMFFLLMSWALPALKAFIKGMSKAERRYFIISCAVWGVFACFIYRNTSLFYNPNTGESIIRYDSLYNMDSGLIFPPNLYSRFVPGSASENDIRQMLFGVFSAPFASVAKWLDLLVFYSDNGYALGMVCTQIAAVRASILLLGRLVVSDENAAWRPWYWMFMELSFSVMLFTLCLEQCVFPVFWVVLLLYAYIKKKPGRDLLYIAATGSLLTSGILFPLIPQEKKFFPAVWELIKAFFTYCGFVITFGCTEYILLSAWDGLDRWINYDKIVPLVSRLYQYINFSSLIFLYPASCINGLYYQLQPVTSVNPIGVLVLALVIVGFVLNRKQVLAHINFAWVLLSVLVIIVVGWGTSQNATIVYAYHMGWAYISLVFMAIMRLFERRPRFKKILLCAVFIAMLIVNVIGGVDILRFGFTVYGAM